MQYIYAGNPYFLDTSKTQLKAPLVAWVRHHPGWAVRWDQEQLRWRTSTVEEVVAALVEDTTFQQVLAGLSSPVGQAVEEAALSQWMDPEEAKLMTAALTRAWKYVRNQNVPVWKRSEVWVGTIGALAVVVAVAFIIRYYRSQP